MEIIKFTAVDFAYRRELVLSDVNFTINVGDFACLVGPNGGGKTTLFKLILGLLKPSCGSVRVFGARPAQHKRRIGYVPQFEKFDPAFPITVIDVVLLGRLGRNFFGWCTRADHAAAMAALEKLHIAFLANAPFARLSGGQKQRVLIARALCTGGELLLLDEPTANLDRQSEIELYEILSGLEPTILVISHNLEMVSRVVRRVICVNRTVTTHQTAEIDGDLFRRVFGERVLIKHDSCER